MLIKNKLLLSAIIGIGSVIILLIVILYFNRIEKESAGNIKDLSVITAEFADLDMMFSRFVIYPDSAAGEQIKSVIHRLTLMIREVNKDQLMADLEEVAENLNTHFSSFEELILSGQYISGWPGTRIEQAKMREDLIHSRFLIQRMNVALADQQIAAIDLQTRIIVIFILPMLLIAVLLILQTSRDLMGKINRLLDDSLRIEKGDFEHRVTLGSNDELGRVASAVNRVADSLNDARLKELEHRQHLTERTNQVNLLKELAMIANRIQNIHELYRIVLDRLRSYTGWISGHIYEVSDDGKVMNPTGIWSVRDAEKTSDFAMVTGKSTFMKNEGIIGRVFESNMPVWIPNIHEDPDFIRKKSLRMTGIESIMAFPIPVEGAVHAVIELHSDRIQNPDDDLIDLFKGAGALLSHVIVRERYISRLNLQTEQLNFAMDSAGMYTWSIDLESNEIQLSRNFKKVLGFRDDRTGSVEEFNEHVHPDDRDEAVKVFNQLIHDRKPYSSEFRFITDQGDILHLWSKGDVIMDAEDKPQKVAGIIMDITSRKLIESRLEASEENYRLLFERSPLPLWVFTDRNLRIIDANTMMEKIFGYGKNELLQFGMQDLIHEDQLENTREVLWNISTQPFTELETRVKASDGSYLDVLLYASEIRYLGTDCIMATCTDITELKITRKRLLGSIIEGEDRERQRVAVELHDGIGQYLTASNMNLEGLKNDLEKISPKKYQQFMNGLVLLNMAIDETRSLAHTLMPKTLKDYGLVISLKSLIDKIRKTAIPDIFFYTRLDEDKLNIQTKINMYRIIQETMNNSLKHSKCTKIDVQAVMHERMVVILIEDNGVGFEVKKSMKNNNGIGLQSIRNRVISMNGTIEIDSVQGRGTSLTIEIPLAL
jgi:PAS domain S-box-containing protein